MRANCGNRAKNLWVLGNATSQYIRNNVCGCENIPFISAIKTTGGCFIKVEDFWNTLVFCSWLRRGQYVSIYQ